MVELSVQYGNKAHNKGSIKLERFASRLRPSARRGFVRIGVMFVRDIAQRLSGPSHTLFPGCGNPYPGVVSGTLRASVMYDLLPGMGVRIGPGGLAEKYAAAQEFGTSRGVPARPYVKPSFDDKKDEAIKILRDEIFEPLR